MNKVLPPAVRLQFVTTRPVQVLVLSEMTNELLYTGNITDVYTFLKVSAYKSLPGSNGVWIQ